MVIYLYSSNKVIHIHEQAHSTLIIDGTVEYMKHIEGLL